MPVIIATFTLYGFVLGVALSFAIVWATGL